MKAQVKTSGRVLEPHRHQAPKFRDVNGYGYDTPGDLAVQRLKS